MGHRVCRWKTKCKSLQKEADDYKDMNADQANRCDQLVNENDSLRAQVSIQNYPKIVTYIAEIVSSWLSVEFKIYSLNSL